MKTKYGLRFNPKTYKFIHLLYNLIRRSTAKFVVIYVFASAFFVVFDHNRREIMLKKICVKDSDFLSCITLQIKVEVWIADELQVVGKVKWIY